MTTWRCRRELAYGFPESLWIDFFCVASTVFACCKFVAAGPAVSHLFDLGQGTTAISNARPRKASGLLRQKAQHRRLKGFVSDRGHMISPRDIEWPPGRQQGCKFAARTCDFVLGADCDQDRGADRSDLLARQALARAADTGRQAPEVGFGLLRKSAKLMSHGIANIRERRSLQRVGDALRQANAVDEMNS